MSARTEATTIETRVVAPWHKCMRVRVCVCACVRVCEAQMRELPT